MRRARPALLALGVGVAAVLLGSAALGTGTSGQPADGAALEPSSGSSPGSVSASPSASPSVRLIEVDPSQARRVGSVRAMEPRAVRLPGSGWLDVAAVGTQVDGLLDVPADVNKIGWWEGGARIGDPFGSVLLAGHVDSATQGLGPSSTLLTADEGARVSVRTGASTTRWQISSRHLVPIDELGQHPRVLSPQGPARLTLVTCAPPFVESRGGYQNLAVVEALPVDEPGRSRTR